ncbi:MAG TPA: hypothetical protein VJ743_22665 [Albitalea sp.]|nr:hypothetical protein [Albitalea sp.]
MSSAPLRRPQQRSPATDPSRVVALDQARILRAIARRRRYRYVQPRVEREGLGWKIVSPNCSRNIDARGGDIDIAWLVPVNEGAWLLHARDHVQGCWVLKASGVSLHAALTAVCDDALREYWQ